MLKHKFYLAGALRDGPISCQYQIKVTQKNKEWLQNVIIPLFNNLYGMKLNRKQIYAQKDKNLRYYLLFKKKKVWNDLKEEFEMPHDQSYWGTPSFVKNAPPSLVRYYIQGFVDAEGGVPRSVVAGSKIYLHISQKNVETLEFIRRKLRLFGIKSGRVTMSDPLSGTHRITVSGRRSVLNFIKKIGTQHPDKQERFENIKQFLL